MLGDASAEDPTAHLDVQEAAGQHYRQEQQAIFALLESLPKIKTWINHLKSTYGTEVA